MTAPTMLSVEMTGGDTDRMTAFVEVLPEGSVSLELAQARTCVAGGDLTPAEALELSRVLAAAARQLGASDE